MSIKEMKKRFFEELKNAPPDGIIEVPKELMGMLAYPVVDDITKLQTEIDYLYWYLQLHDKDARIKQWQEDKKEGLT